MDKASGKWVLKHQGLTRFWKTKHVYTSVPGEGFIGRVNHFTKKSIDSIVKACCKQVIAREGRSGTHTITIEMVEDWDYINDVRFANPETKTVTITVVV